MAGWDGWWGFDSIEPKSAEIKAGDHPCPNQNVPPRRWTFHCRAIEAKNEQSVVFPILRKAALTNVPVRVGDRG